eukprot:m.169443 g.169443  ORF g.169443 m.169443 type:complete len:648 (+) comp10367_c0_seq11:1236-3179(+)
MAQAQAPTTQHAPAPVAPAAPSTPALVSPVAVPAPVAVAVSVAAAGPAAGPVAAPAPATVLSSAPEPVDPDNIIEGIDQGLIQAVREECGVSFEQSRMAVEVIARMLVQKMASTPEALPALVSALTTQTATDGGRDAEQLTLAFEALTEVVNDSQQRSWATHEDADAIMRLLGEITSLVEDGDPRLVKCMLRDFVSPGHFESYEIVGTLVDFYQMETRVELRLALLELFLRICEREPAVVPILQGSILPVELARDATVGTGTPDKKLLLSLQLIAGIFSCGLPIPIAHREYLNAEFVEAMITLIESPPVSDENEQASDLAVNVLLAFNLGFLVPVDEMFDENLILQVVGTRCLRVFGEKLLLLANRGQDPVAFESRPTHAVFKLLIDLASRHATGRNFFYTNDLRVLMDVLLRELTDRDRHDERFPDFLLLTSGVLRNTPLADDPYRLDELQVRLPRPPTMRLALGNFVLLAAGTATEGCGCRRNLVAALLGLLRCFSLYFCIIFHAPSKYGVCSCITTLWPELHFAPFFPPPCAAPDDVKSASNAVCTANFALLFAFSAFFLRHAASRSLSTMTCPKQSVRLRSSANSPSRLSMTSALTYKFTGEVCGVQIHFSRQAAKCGVGVPLTSFCRHTATLKRAHLWHQSP